MKTLLDNPTLNRWIHKIHKFKRRKVHNRILVSGVLIATLTVIATIFGLFLQQFEVHESSIIMIYLLAALLVAYIEEGFANSFITSFVVVMVYNFFFTEPFYTFQVTHAEHWITFTFMYLASVSVTALTMRLKKVAKQSNVRELRTFLLFHLSDRLVRAKSVDEIRDIVGEDISGILKIKAVVSLVLEDQTFEKPVLFEKGKRIENYELSSHHLSCIQNVYERQISSKEKSEFSDDMNVYYIPILGTNICYGVIGFSIYDGERIDAEKSELGTAIATQIAMAIEREQSLLENNIKSVVEESERIKVELLTSMALEIKGAVVDILSIFEETNGKDPSDRLNEVLKHINKMNHSIDNMISLTEIEAKTINL